MSSVPDTIKNIVFDFGGVIINIDFNRAFEAFSHVGCSDVKEAWKKAWTSGLLTRFEKGDMAPDAFRKEMAVICGNEMDAATFDAAWNAMLLDIPESRVRLIERLKKRYRVFLLSNTNQIHYDNYSSLAEPYGYPVIDDLFHGAWFSFRMGLVKPDVAIYQALLEKEQLIPAETLFVDDLAENVAGAEKAGMAGLHIQPGTLTEGFADY